MEDGNKITTDENLNNLLFILFVFVQGFNTINNNIFFSYGILDKNKRNKNCFVFPRSLHPTGCPSEQVCRGRSISLLWDKICSF